MRKILFVLLLTSFPLCSTGRVVTRDRAEECAARFFNSVSTRGTYPELTMVWDGSTALTRSVESPAFYVFNNSKGGFVIISGEDAARPVLGYSHSGSFKPDDMPDNLVGWMDNYRGQIGYMRDNGISAGSDVERMWTEIGARTRASETEVILNTALWGQKAPFNDKCPPINYLVNCPSGCAATAAATVMFYHRTPEGEILSDDGKSVLDGYDWDNMLLDYRDGYTKVQGEAVANLVSTVGVRAKINYNPHGSTTNPENVLDALRNYRYADGSYVFDRGMNLQAKDEYTSGEWIRMMKYEIDEDRPLLYYGYNEYRGGHAFVVDGYGEGEYFHFNWGDDGEYDGMYLLSAMRENRHYVYGNKAIMGFRPDTSIPLLSLDGSVSLSQGSINSKGWTFKIQFDGITNSGDIPYSGKLKVALVGADGDVKAFFGESSVSDLAAGESTSRTISVSNTNPLALGDRFVLYYSVRGNMVPVLRKDETMALPAVDMSAIYVNPEGYKAGDEFVFSLTNTTEARSSVAWTFDGESVSEPSVTLTSGTHKIKCVITYSDGTTEKLMQGIIVK